MSTVEEFLAQKIESLRTGAGWSYADLSQRMADAGCPIERSSLQKIEKGQPRRKITVNELAAFSTVFNMSVTDLLISPEDMVAAVFTQDMTDGPEAKRAAVMSESRLTDLVGRVAKFCMQDETREKLLRLFIRTDEKIMGDNVTDSFKYGFHKDVIDRLDSMRSGENG